MSEQKSVPKLRQKRKFWRAHVNAWKKSGLSQAEYSRRQGLNVHRLGYWINNKSSQTTQSLTLVEVPTQNMETGNAVALKLVVNNHYQIEIGNQFSSETLEKVLQVLRRPL